MTDEEHKVCELEKKIAVLEQSNRDAATALILARDISTARWSSFIALLVSLIGLAVSLLRH